MISEESQVQKPAQIQHSSITTGARAVVMIMIRPTKQPIKVPMMRSQPRWRMAPEKVHRPAKAAGGDDGGGHRRPARGFQIEMKADEQRKHNRETEFEGKSQPDKGWAVH